MLPSLIKSVLPHRFLYPQRRRFRDRTVAQTRSGASTIRLLSFLIGGLLLASAVMLLSEMFRSPAPETSDPTQALRHAAAVSTTDGRAVTELPDDPPAERHAVTARIDPGCAAFAREKLSTALTNYYLQRRLRPGATSDDAAEISSQTVVLAGPGDPAAMTPETSCNG
ncbi:hypothetical protein [Pseudorhodoplanes sp.]|uniref:hypothetical protein n=1 Tax=Pseudorhodoplanes sp. TaxID=1934341 RepID=UPI002CBE2BC3|nr:hypothetical protein [Pseudorhodoplanes sp.]HWV55228.1 hypothetical protein [Pseudorhodoplanes sp.]